MTDLDEDTDEGADEAPAPVDDNGGCDCESGCRHCDDDYAARPYVRRPVV